MTSDDLIQTRSDRSGNLRLETLRPTALRIGRLAEALFDAIEADVVIVHDGKVWRGKPSTDRHDDAAAAEIAMLGDDFFWLEDTHEDARWRSHPQTQSVDGIRFRAGAPIRLKTGFRLGALHVSDTRPRPFDAKLAERLKDLAAIVADECDRLVNHEAWMLRELFEQSPVFVAVMDGPDYIFRMINPAFLAFVGERPIVDLPVKDAIPEVVDQDLIRILDDVFESGRARVGQGVAITLDRGLGGPERRYVDFVLQPIFDVNGKVASIFLQGADVTYERESVKALEANRAALEATVALSQAIFDSSLDVICTVSEDGRFTQVSKSAIDVWGYEAEDLIGRPFLDFVHPDDRDITMAMHGQIVGGRPTSVFRNRYLHKDGTAVPVMWSAAWSEQTKTVIAIARDVREAIASAEKLRQAQKMEAVGRLTGGVAHDFNNLLTVIIGGAETLVAENPDKPAVRDLADMILKAGERGSELTSQLLAFARRQPLEPRALEVNELLGRMEALLRRTLGEDIELRLQPGRDIWCAMADPAQLESAVLNLAINARDAMPEGGKLTIETGNVTLDWAYSIANEGVTAGDYLMIAVTDNGMGMSKETAAQAFEPFFTTKPTGKGTGLGLSMVHGFANQSKGSVKIYSELGVGTTVKIYLPRADVSDALAPAKADAHEPPKGAEHILLVEDDDLLRDHARKQLDSLGYKVSVAEDGPSALALLDTLGPFDLLFTDVVMPGGMNGRQLAERVVALRPGTKVLYASGYTENAIVHHGQLDAGIDLLHKPYRKADLAIMVRKVLDALPRLEGDGA